MVNWSSKKKIKTNKNYFQQDSSILINGGKDFYLGNNNDFTFPKEKVFTFEFSLKIELNTRKERIGEFGIAYEYENEFGNPVRLILFKSDTLMTDTLESKKWYNFSKSMYLVDIKNIKFSIYYK